MNKTNLFLPWFCALLATPGLAQSTIRVSIDSNNIETDGPSFAPSVCTGGRFVAFESQATNLVPGDTGWTDVFVRDLLLVTTVRVSTDPNGMQSDGHSTHARISADGRFVAFQSAASNLVAGDTNAFEDVFVHDRQTGVTERVSVDSSGVEGNRASFHPSISSDGRFVAFTSRATNLVPSDTNAASDIFVRDRLTGTTERVSLDGAGAEGNAGSSTGSIGADGRYVAFTSAATNLVSGDLNGKQDVFVRDRQLGTTELASASSGGVQGNGDSFDPVIAGDGRWVAFTSFATNFLTGDTASDDVFVRDRQTGTTECASTNSQGVRGNGPSSDGWISDDGNYVTFDSSATNFVPNDTNFRRDVFLKNRRTGVTQRISLTTFGHQSDGDCDDATISPDGRFVAFANGSTDLVFEDDNHVWDAFVRDRGIPLVPMCFGDGSNRPCPCGNDGAPAHGCDNSAATGGAILTATGAAERPNDTFVLTSTGEKATALSIFLQGPIWNFQVYVFGDGLRCVHGGLKRLYVKNAVGGVVAAPQGAEPSVSTRSAALGDPIPAGLRRHYQVYYRDPDPSFCPNPPGNTFNVSSGLSVIWDF